MAEDTSFQLISQLNESVQKLFDLTNRIDEREKIINDKQKKLEEKIDHHNQKIIEVFNKVGTLETFIEQNNLLEKKIKELESQISKVEANQGVHNENWKNIANFLIQIVWVILAAYVLTKLNLAPPL